MRNRYLFVSLLAIFAASRGLAVCGGDCSGDGSVSFDEITVGVDLALGVDEAGTTCPGYSDSDPVTVSDLVTTVNHAVSGCNAPTATPSPSATQIMVATPTPPPRPGVPAGCTKSGGYTRVVFSQASGTNTLIDISHPLDLFGVSGGTGEIARSVSASSVTCPTSLTDPIVLLTTGVAGFPQEVAAGNVYPISGAPVFMLPYIEVTTISYTERLATNPLNGLGWQADSGSFTVVAIDGDKITLRIEAHMVPLAPTAATGTFQMQIYTVVDKVMRN